MFKYNTECKTKVGEHLIPLTMEGGYVVCANKKGETVYKLPSDFDTSSATVEEKENVVIAVAKKSAKVVSAISSTNNVGKKDSFVYVAPVVQQVEAETAVVEETVIQETVVAKPNKTPGSKLVDFEGDIQVIKDDFRTQDIKASSASSKVNDEEYI